MSNVNFIDKTQLVPYNPDPAVINAQDITELKNAVNSKLDASGLSKDLFGLADVDNTSDLNKPISTATQSALDNKADKSQIGSAVKGTAVPTTSAPILPVEGDVWLVNTSNLDATYTNFGNQLVPAKVGELYSTNNRFVRSNNSWVLLRELVTIPTQDISGLATKAEFNSLKANRKSLDLNSASVTGMELLADGTTLANASFITSYYKYVGGNLYVSLRTGSVSGRQVVFFDASGVRINSLTPILAQTSTISNFKIASTSIPAGTASIGFSGFASTGINVLSEAYPDIAEIALIQSGLTANNASINITYADVANIKANKVLLELESSLTGKALANNNTLVDTASFITRYYKYNYDKDNVHVYINTKTTTLGLFVLYLNADKTVIVGVRAPLIAGTTNLDLELTPPVGTEIIAFSSSTTSSFQSGAYQKIYATKPVDSLLSTDAGLALAASQGNALDIKKSDAEYEQFDAFTNIGVVNSLGADSTNGGNGGRRSDYLPTLPGFKFRVDNVTRWYTHSPIAFYDADKVFISAYTVSNSGGILATTGIVTAPERTAYVRMSYLGNSSGVYVTLFYRQMSAKYLKWLNAQSVQAEPTRMYKAGDSIGTTFGFITSDVVPNVLMAQKHVGGENVLDTMAAVNAYPYMCEPFTIPADTATGVVLDMYSSYGFKYIFDAEGRFTWQKGKFVYPLFNKGVTINGVVGNLVCERPATNVSKVTFYRETAGTAVVCDRPTKIYRRFGKEVTNAIWLISAGTNGGFAPLEGGITNFEDADNLLSFWKDMFKTQNPQTQRFIIMSHYVGKSPAWFDYYERIMEKEFGNRFFNTRKYMMTYAMVDRPATPTSADYLAISQGKVPPVCIPDGTHPGSATRVAICNQLLERMQGLGWIEKYNKIPPYGGGDTVDDGTTQG
jgi:hypothetical protein